MQADRDNRGKNNSRAHKPVIIYDAGCPICSSVVEWIKKQEQTNGFETLPCQSDERRNRCPDIDEAVCLQAMQLVLPDGTVLSGEKALPEILKRLPQHHAAARLFDLPGSNAIARAFYRWFARRRYGIADILFPAKKHRHNRAA